MLGELAARGLLEDGLAAHATSDAALTTARIEPLAGYRLRCEGHGACCTSFASIIFTDREARAALRAVPERAAIDRVFLPLWGSGDEGASAVTLDDGRCSFLGSDGACLIHARAGAEQKPLGCRLFPRSFVDDGEAVRVSVRLECPCVLSSIGASDGEPLADEILPGTSVIALDERIELTRERSATRSELRAWSVCASIGERADAVASFWSLADTVETHGLATAPSIAALERPITPTREALLPMVEALARRAAARSRSADGWRSPHDRVRQLAAWMAHAAAALQQSIDTALAKIDHPADEALYLRAVIHGHHAAIMDKPLGPALRELSVRALLARAAARHVPEGCGDDRSVAHPLSAVEMMMRAQGLGGWDSPTK
jgi:lysine-N-methylase